MSYASIIGQAEAQQAASKSTSKSDMAKDDFLKLLVAQLTHQDPMNPMDDKDMTAQLAQFSQLEQLTNINTGITQLVSNDSKNQMLTAVSYIGKSIVADGYNVSKDASGVSTVCYTLDSAVAALQMNIYDNEGNIVRSEALGATQAGTYAYKWDGNDSTGQAAANGIYSVGILAETADGQSVMATTRVSGEVTGAGTDSSTGQQYLVLKDGRTVNLLNVTEVVASS